MIINFSCQMMNLNTWPIDINFELQLNTSLTHHKNLQLSVKRNQNVPGAAACFYEHNIDLYRDTVIFS